MACSTCNHTMTNLGTVPAYFHCPRCGTLKAARPEEPEDVVCPMLVQRVRDLHEVMQAEAGWAHWHRAAWHRLGITEAAWPPETRPVP